jgi:thioredoxin reductase (NADPH)
MTAALYLLRAGRSIAMVERLSTGGQVLMTEMIENYPGFPAGVAGWELADIFAKHLEGYAFDRYSDDVRGLEPGTKGHRILVGSEWIEAKTIVICTGCEYKKIGIPGEKELLGRGVSYCALCDGNFFRNQTVAVIGGGNSALEESLYLAKIVEKLYLVHRRETFRGTRCFQDRCAINPKIEMRLNTVPVEIKGKDKVVGIVVEDKATGGRYELTVDGVFIFVGFQPLAGFVPDRIVKDEQGFIITDSEMRTNVPGIFAAGDVRSKLCRQVTTAVGDGATAANAAFIYLESHHD